MSGQLIETGLHFSGADAANINVGFVPDAVIMFKTGSVPAMNVWVRMKVCAFTSGGTYEIKPGDVIQGATSTLVRAEVRAVQVTSGTWAGGDAAGNLYWQDIHQTGTFGSENVDLLAAGGTALGGGGVGTANVATVTAQTEAFNFALNGNATPASSSYTSVTPAQGIQPFGGSIAGGPEGFTITDTLATAGDAWFWIAIRGTFTL